MTFRNTNMIPEIMKTDIKNLGYARLFGSRSMAARPSVEGFDPSVMIGSQINDSTDWDFSQQYNDYTHSYLLSAGFTHYAKDQIGPYADDLTVGVYIKEYTPKFNMGNLLAYRLGDVPKINVVLHSDELFFRQVWDRISPEFYYRYLWKRSPQYDHIDSIGERKQHIREIMNQLFAVAQ
jgi:hypothetical protein